MKKIMIAIVLLVLLAVGGAFLLFFSLDSIVKTTIEQVGSEVTGTDVFLSEVEISLSDGRGSLRDLRVTNPQGFERDDAFQFDSIEIKIDMSTIGSGLIVIEEVVVDKPRIRLELGKTGSNIRRIRKHAEDHAPKTPSGPKLIIKDLHFREGKITLAGAKLFKDGVTRPLPDFHVREIGTEEGGVSPAAIAQRVIRALERKAGGDTGEKLFDLLSIRG